MNPRCQQRSVRHRVTVHMLNSGLWGYHPDDTHAHLHDQISTCHGTVSSSFTSTAISVWVLGSVYASSESHIVVEFAAVPKVDHEHQHGDQLMNKNVTYESLDM